MMPRDTTAKQQQQEQEPCPSSTADGDRTRAPPRATNDVPSEVVDSGNGSPDMSDTSISSSRSSSATASNAADDHRQQRHAVTDADTDDDDGVRPEAPSPSAAILARLARQLEYYFSSRNLARDTYLQTLRSLNDGCVPVAILANFAKVRAIVAPHGDVAAPDDEEEARFHAILQATAEHSDLLRVCSIETSTGKIATDDTPSSATTILAVGPVSGEPLVLRGGDDDEDDDNHNKAVRTTQSAPTSLQHLESSSPTAGGTTNTIILREVHPEVTEAEVRELFNFEGCPEIESVRPDVAHCWYVAANIADLCGRRCSRSVGQRTNLTPCSRRLIPCSRTCDPGSSRWTRRRGTTCCGS